MRELKYYVACTVDRFIAREDGSFDFFLREGEHLAALIQLFPESVPGHLRDALGVRAANRCFDAVLMGRRTYEVGINVGVTNPYPHLKQYLFSSTLKESPDENVELVSGGRSGVRSGIEKAARKRHLALRRRGFSHDAFS